MLNVGKLLSAFALGSGFSFLSISITNRWKIPNLESDVADITPERKEELQFKYGVPDGGRQVRQFKNHALVYDQCRKIPLWVYEHITKEGLRGSASRRNSRFSPDTDVPPDFQAVNEDYKRSGWSRGHMSPAGNHKHDQAAMNDSFLLSNVLPQDFRNNAQFWNSLEMYCRDLTRKYKDVYIFSGPVFGATIVEGTKKYVKHELIGDNDVAVPTHLYKIIVAEEGGTTDMGAFIVPNVPLESSEELKDYQVSLSTLEKRTGVRFLPNLVHYRDLCYHNNCQIPNVYSSKQPNVLDMPPGG